MLLRMIYVAAVLGWLATAGVHAGGDKPAALCTAAPGIVLAKDRAGWQAVAPGKPVPLETPVVALFDATVRSGNGAVELRLLTDPGQRGPLPILESAVILHADAGCDLTLTPLRGLLVLTNLKQSGSATIRLAARGETLDVTLQEPGAKLALELYGRHAPGAPKLDAAKADEPVMHLFCIALKGTVLLHCQQRGVTLHAPPGPAVLVWDSVLREPQIERLESLPPEMTALKAEDQQRLDAVCKWARKLADESLPTVLRQGANASSAVERRAAVIAMGALDELPSLLGVLAGSKHADARKDAILALRHWLGRAPGQTAILQTALRSAGYSEVQAQNLLQLLYGFTPAQRRQPSTYEMLVAELNNNQPAVRELAHWHLVRLAPAGRAIEYDALAPEAQRQQALQQWRKLIPSGEVPTVKTAPK